MGFQPNIDSNYLFNHNQNRIIMQVEPKPIKSIQEALAYLNNSELHLFFIGRPYCNSPLDLHDFVPNFEIISCFDAYHGKIPFIKVPDFIKDTQVPHKCSSATECQALLLRNPEVIAYIKGKSSKPKVFYMMIDAECQRLCQENSLQFWGPSNEAYSLLGNKVKIIKILEKANIPFIPNICSKIINYEHYLQLIKDVPSKDIVVQTENGVSGMGTCFISNKQDYDRHAVQLESGLSCKIMPYKRLKSFGISAITGSFGTVIGPIHSQVIGHKKLTPFRGGFCANQQRDDYFADPKIDASIRREMFSITKSFGDYLYKEKIFRGMFGIDFVVDLETYQVYFMQINPRLTGSTTISYQLYEAEGIQFPLAVYHCLEFMDARLEVDIASYNIQWQELTHYHVPATHIAIKPFSELERNLTLNIPSGLWRLSQGKLVFTGKFTYKIKQMEENQFFFIPNRGYAKGNIIMKKKCQHYQGGLTQEVQEIIDRILELISQAN